MSGNGSLMRLCPIPLLYVNSAPSEVAAVARASSLPTHASTLCTGACALFALYVHHLIHSTLPTPAERKRAVLDPSFDLLAGANDRNVLANSQIENIRQGKGWRGLTRDEIHTSGFVIHSLQAALWALDTFDTFEEGMMTLLKMGGDVDTVSLVTLSYPSHFSTPSSGMLHLWSDRGCMLWTRSHSASMDRRISQERHVGWVRE
jgi:ADP-ribosyl-[dinitrogen reductase] hydrolase